jgi:tRNA nucleotidyltransferase (CCA-adding enzyme)
VVREAERRGVEAYLVGGPVRDLLLGETIGDVDVLLSDGLEAVARGSALRLGGRAVIHEKFLTATIVNGDLRIDLSRARGEAYARPGALPQVHPASLADDFGRRDFSINAMAIRLSAGAGPVFVDALGGLADLERGRLRVLHPESFRDDPTRLFRAARYAARLRFRPSRETLRLMREAISEGALATVSGDRTLAELGQLLKECDAARACREADKHGLFSAVASGWGLSADARQGLHQFNRVKQSPPWSEAAQPSVQQGCGLRLLLVGTPARVRARSLAALGLQGRRASSTETDLRQLGRLRRSVAGGLSPGKLDARLTGLGEALLLALYCLGGRRVRSDVARFANELRHQRSPLDGHTARRLGLKGPAIGRIVRAARERALDGRPVNDAWLRRWLAR